MRNDFTKEELQLILASLESGGDYSTATCDYSDLMNKLQSMIDNYPESCPNCNQHGCIYLFEIEGKKFEGWSCDNCGSIFKMIDNYDSLANKKHINNNDYESFGASRVASWES